MITPDIKFVNNIFLPEKVMIMQGTLCRTSSIESTIRNVTKEAVKEAGRSFCVCGGRAVENGCRTCLMKEVCRRLQNAGFNSAICKSKWKSSTDIPSGIFSLFYFILFSYLLQIANLINYIIMSCYYYKLISLFCYYLYTPTNSPAIQN